MTTFATQMKRQDQHIQKLIEEGEHQMLDFKFEISDSRRIARSLAAFANTDGGRLLVGVKDNGAIAGVRSDEEIHMIEAAAEMYCSPKVEYQTKEWEINGKTVLEVIIPKDNHDKHKAPDNQGNYKIYVRVKDENLVADSVLLRVWKFNKFSRPAKIAFTETEESLLRYLNEYGSITLQDFQTMAHINKRKAEAILADFIMIGTIKIVQTSQNTTFQLAKWIYFSKIMALIFLFLVVFKNLSCCKPAVSVAWCKIVEKSACGFVGMLYFCTRKTEGRGAGSREVLRSLKVWGQQREEKQAKQAAGRDARSAG